jgi:hypothetical protein
MNKISLEELEQKIEAGEEVIDRYFDAGTTRVGTRHTILTSVRDKRKLKRLAPSRPQSTYLDKTSPNPS